MDPNAQSTANMMPEQSSGGSRNTLMTLASLLVLAGIVGITLWLYIQNKSSVKNSSSQNNSEKEASKEKEKQMTDEELAAIPTLTQKEQDKVYNNVVCRRFTSIEDALKTPDIACELDLSNKNLSSLPSAISRLVKLNSIQLNGNQFTQIPPELLTLKKLIAIDLSNNNISSVDDSIISTLPELQTLNLSGNSKIDKSTVEKFNEISITDRFVYSKTSKSNKK